MFAHFSLEEMKLTDAKEGEGGVSPSPRESLAKRVVHERRRKESCLQFASAKKNVLFLKSRERAGNS